MNLRMKILLLKLSCIIQRFNLKVVWFATLEFVTAKVE